MKLLTLMQRPEGKYNILLKSQKGMIANLISRSLWTRYKIDSLNLMNYTVSIVCSVWLLNNMALSHRTNDAVNDVKGMNRSCSLASL